MKIPSFAKTLFQKFDICLSQNNETTNYLKNLGVKQIKNLGNLKYSTSKIQFGKKLDIKLIKYFNKKKILLTSASIHPEEENFSL